jgi:hypothetical protein
MEDHNLVALSNEIDSMIHRCIKNYDIASLSLTGVILARLKIVAEATQQIDEFNKLCVHVADTKFTPRTYN